MLYREMIAVCSEIHTKHRLQLCGQNVEFVNDKAGNTFQRSLHFSSCRYHLFVDVVRLGEAHSGEVFKGQLVLLASLSLELSLVDPSSSDGRHTHAVTDEDYYVLGVT